MEILRRAVASGAEVWSRAPVVGVRHAGAGLEVSIAPGDGAASDGWTDRYGTGSDLPDIVTAARVAVCVGPEGPAIEGVVPERPAETPPAGLAYNVLIRRALPGPQGVALETFDGEPTLFAYPFGSWTLAGTAHEAATLGPVGTPSAAGVRRLVERLAGALADWPVGPSDVIRVFAGVLPCRGVGSDEQVARPSLATASGLGDRALVVVGTKYTTAPGLARRVVDRLVPASRPAPPPGPDGTVRVPDAAGFLDLSARDPAAAGALVRTLGAEGAHTLEDIVLRRSDWGLDPDVGEEIEARIATLEGRGS